MKKKKPLNKNLLSILILIIGVALVATYYIYKKESQSNNLKPVEVKEYQGKNLSSIDDFRENSIKGPQYINRNDYKLNITGANNNRSYTYDEIIKNFKSYQKTVELNCVEGWSVNILWEGPLIKEIIPRGQVPNSANTVIFKAYDGYTTSFPIDYIYNNDIILADKMNGVELPPERGFPFQLVAESKWGYKWIKWITDIEFSTDANYKGYWESRGYSNTGDLDKSKFSE